MFKTKRILIPTDFSKNAVQTYAYAKAFAQNNNTKIDLVYIIQSLSYLEISREVAHYPLDVKEITKRMEQQFIDELQQELESNFDEDLRGQVYIKHSVKAVKGILEQLEEEQYDLVIMGSRGRGESDLMRGSTTQQLVRSSPVPVLSFKKDFNPEKGNVLVPTDGSLVSLKALLVALSLVQEANFQVYSVVDLDFDAVGYAPPAPDMYRTLLNERKKDIIENIRELMAYSDQFDYKVGTAMNAVLIEDENGREIQIEIIIENRASAYRAILDYAEENADMVVMTTRGRSGFKRIVIGSVTEKVVRHLDIPICTIKPERQ